MHTRLTLKQAADTREMYRRLLALSKTLRFIRRMGATPIVLLTV